MAFLDDLSDSAHTLTLSGDATGSLAVQQFGDSSLSLQTVMADGACSTPTDSDFQFGADPFTVEGWFYWSSDPDTAGGVTSLFDQFGVGTVTDGAWRLAYASAINTLIFTYTTDGSTQHNFDSSGAFFPATDTWYHIAVVRDGSNNLSVYAGVAGTTNDTICSGSMGSDVIHVSSLPLTIGNDATGASEMGGYVDEVRITKGVARYATNFTPPASAFPTSSGGDADWSSVVLLAPFDGFVGSDITLALTGVAAVGSVGAAVPNPLGKAAMVLPVPVLRATVAAGVVMTSATALPVPVLKATGYTSVTAGMNLALSAPQLRASGLVGASGSAALSLPVPVLSGGAPGGMQLTLPVPQLVATGVTGVVARAALTLPSLQLAAGLSVPYVGRAALTLPVPQLSAQGVQGAIGTIGSTANVLRGLALAAQGFTGTVGTAVLTLPMMQLDSSGFMQVTGGAQLTLPVLQLVATGSTVSTGTPATVAMHTETSAVWTYSNYPFNSYAQFNGVYLGASNGGIFALTGDTDNGALIQAAARVGITDFGTSFLKRVDRCYVGYRTNGNLVLRCFTDEVNVRDYLLTATGKAGLHGNHTRLGKGLAARYYQFEVRNQNGADFEMNMIELKPTELKRRVGGGDA